MEPVAVIGFSFKLPKGVENAVSLWDILENGRNLMTAWPEDRTSIKSFYSVDSAQINKLHSTGGHFLDGNLGEFDAPFFSINAKEAKAMDPQQQLLLETSYRALENAGVSLKTVAGSATGVFAGSMSDDYSRIVAKDPDEAAVHAATGQTMAMLANRVSWFFDMKGPSVQVNTACSSSMIAVDLACQSLRTGQSSMALVTGSSIMLSPEMSLYLTNMNVLSPDSLCYSFDHRANGYARGDGIIVFVLKRLSDAVTDGDTIRAVIRATGSNQDGHTPGITQPSIDSQEELIRTVYKSCGLGFESTLYVEAHGTGTQLGDSSEAKALGRVFKSSRSRKSPLYIGSIKANIGHLEGGSGLAGMLKSILILEKGVIPPNALFEKLNPKINARGLNIQIPTSCIPWPSDGVRRISVNSFGFGGSNGHVVLDDAYHYLQEMGLTGNHLTQVKPAKQTQAVDEIKENDNITNGDRSNGHPPVNNATGNHRPTENLSKSTHNRVLGGHVCVNGESGSSEASSTHKILVWSSKDENAIRRMVQEYAGYLETHNVDLDRLAYTLAMKRSAMNWRSFAVVEASNRLSLPPKLPFIRSSFEMGLAFVFTGQGAQYAGMGRELLIYPAFRLAMVRANAVFRDLGATWTLDDALRDPERINNPQLSQPVCTALQLGLVELLKSFNIIPEAVVGHSSGEIAAAYTVGALSFQSACKVAYHRGRLTSQLAAATSIPGAMMSVNLPETQVKSYLDSVEVPDGHIYIACVNSPLNVTLSGDEKFIDLLKNHFDQDGTFARKLATGVAYHSPAMQEIASEYYSSLGTLDSQDLSDSNILMVSSVTCDKVSRKQLTDSKYWIDNLVSPVRFSDALHYLEATAPRADGLKPLSIYLEIGPTGALRRPVCDTLGSITAGKSVQHLSTLSRLDPPLATILNISGQLFVRGYPVSITSVNQQKQDSGQPFLVDTPEYPFDHSRNYWYESRMSRDWRLRESVPNTILGLRTTDWNPVEPRWRAILSIQDVPWIADHVIGDVPYLPGTGILMAALEAVKQTAQAHKEISGFVVKEITFMSPIVVRPEGKTEVITQLRPLQKAYEKMSVRFEVRTFACVDSYWNQCSKAIIHVKYSEDNINEVDGGREAVAAARDSVQLYDDAKEICVKSVSKTDFHRWHTEQGLKYGHTFSLTENTSWDGGEIGIGHINSSLIDSFDGIVHPGALDSAFQVASLATSCGMTKSLPAMIIHKLEEVWISSTGWQYPDTSQIRVVARSKLKKAVPGVDCDFTMLRDNGTLICRVQKLEMLPAGARDDMKRIDNKNKLFHSVAWKPQLSEFNQSQLQDYCHDLDTFLELASHEVPNQRLLEIGAGSIATMNHIVSILERIEENIGGIAFTQYLYTAASVDLLDQVREKETDDRRARLNFATFDVEKDISAQDLDQSIYNMIILSEADFSRASKDMASVLRNIRRALRPGGYLLVRTPTGSPKNLSTENNSPSQRSKLETLLKTCGFSGIDLVIPGPEECDMLISGATVEPAIMQKRGSLLVVDNEHEYLRSIVSHLLETTLFHNSEVVSISQLAADGERTDHPKSVVFLADMTGSLLAQMPDSFFGPTQKLLQNTNDILWVTSTNYFGKSQLPMPFSGIKDGFLRTMRAEYSSKRIISLALEGDNEVYSSKDAARYINKAFTSGFIDLKPEVEYIIRNGLFYTGRLVSETAIDAKIAVIASDSNSTGPSVIKQEALIPGPALKVDITSPGSLETLRLVQDDIRDAELGPTEVEIEAKTWGLNFRDVFIALGRLEEDDFGTDCAGVVTRVGSQCHLLQPGDRVCMAALGCMRMFPRSDERAVAKIPDGVEFADACAIVTPAITAWRALVDVARIEKGDKVLIHAASGGTGQFAIQIAKYFGAEVFATVGYSYKKQLLKDTYGIPEDHIFYSRDTAFADGIKRVTGGYGVDIVLNSLVGEGLRASWECVAPYGRFIEIGKADIQSNSSLPMAHFAKNVAFAAVDLRHILLSRQDILTKLMHKTMDLVAKETFRAPAPLHLYKVSALEEAFRYFQSGKNTGRIIIDLDSSSIVQKHFLPHRRSWSFDSTASYVVAGGFGGIGRSILKWMAKKGAKYLIVPSRSGTAHKAEAAEIIEDLDTQGVTVSTPQIDVSVAEDLNRVLEECSKTLPHIKGCINAAMVLNDSMFDNMTHSQWEKTIRSKVQTSWNLHNLLPDDLDFFILLSSISGVIGNSGQSNYAAGCTFQDALAQYRIRTGQSALSIDLGVIRDVGVVAESENIQKKLTSGLRQSRQISESEILACMDLCCDPGQIPPGLGHITMGLGTPANLIAQDIEPPEFMKRPLFAAHISPLNAATAANNENYSAMFRSAESVEERAQIVFQSLAKKLARALMIKPEEIDANQPLHLFGVDSLVAMEIKNWIAKEFVADVAVFELMGGRSVAAICELVTKTSQFQVKGQDKGLGEDVERD